MNRNSVVVLAMLAVVAILGSVPALAAKHAVSQKVAPPASHEVAKVTGACAHGAQACPVSDPSKCPAGCRRAQAGVMAAKVASH